MVGLLILFWVVVVDIVVITLIGGLCLYWHDVWVGFVVVFLYWFVCFDVGVWFAIWLDVVLICLFIDLFVA